MRERGGGDGIPTLLIEKGEASLIKTIAPWGLIKLSNLALSRTHGMIS